MVDPLTSLTVSQKSWGTYDTYTLDIARESHLQVDTCCDIVEGVDGVELGIFFISQDRRWQVVEAG
jgi:hypothetical protein